MAPARKTKHKGETAGKGNRAREADDRHKDSENTINILQDEIKRLSDEMFSKDRCFKKENSDLKQKLTSTQEENIKKDQLLKETKDKLVQRGREKKKYKKEQEDLSKKLADVEEQLREKDQRLEETSKAIVQLVCEAQKFKEEQEDLFKKLREKDQHLEETSKVIESLEGDIMKLREILKKQEERISQSGALHKEMEAKLGSCRVINKQLEDQLVLRQQTFEEVLRAQEQILEKERKLKEDEEALVLKQQTFENEKRFIIEEVSSAQEQLSEKEQQLRENEEALENIIKQFEARQGLLEDTVNTLLAENQFLKEAIVCNEERFKSENDINMQTLSNLQEQVREEQQSLIQTESELDREQAQTRQLQEKLAESQSSCKTLTERNEFYERQTALLENQLRSLRQVDENCRLLVQENAEIEQEKNCLTEEMGKISSGYNMLLYRERELGGTLTKSENTVLQLRNELYAAKERIKRIKEENKHLQMTIEGLRRDELIFI